MLRRTLLAGNSAGGPGYDTHVASLSPLLWWKGEETTGNTVADSSGNGYVGTMPGGIYANNLADTTIPAVSGYAGLGRGQRFNTSAISGRIESPAAAALSLGTSATGAWTLVLWLTGSPGGSQYVFGRASNHGNVIYNFVADTVEFFSGTYTGSDPRPGTGISLPSADTTTPHMIVYRYNNGTWSGRKNKTSAFSVARSFALSATTVKWALGALAGGGASCFSRIYDAQLYATAISDADLDTMYDLRNTAG